jgi:23S rRNA pseudouridine2604 synthase
MSEKITYPIRLNKYLAYSGFCSRREADALIEKHKVYVNGRPAPLGYMVQESDKVELHRGLQMNHTYIAYYKPRNIVTHSPQGDEIDIASKLLREDVFPVGRLDKDSEGLIIVTNDGRVTKRLLSPESNHEKEYIVRVDKRLTKSAITRLARGVHIEGYTTKPAKVKMLSEKRLSIILTEGKKHQVRRMLAALGYTTLSLKRVRIGSILLGTLKSGETRELKGSELERFKKEMGL